MLRYGDRVRFPVFLVALTAAAVVVAGCTEPVVQSPDELRENLDLPEAEEMAIGEPTEHRDVEVTIQDIEAMERTRESVNRLRVTVRSENVGDVAGNNPAIQIVCDENPDGGDWHEGSTWEPARGIDAGVVLNGEVILGFPYKPDSVEYTVQECTNAALRVVWGRRGRDDQAVGLCPIPEDVIDEAMKEPTGPPLPLETPPV